MENSIELSGKFLGTISSDFVIIADKLKEAAYQIKKQDFSDFPIFIFCKEYQPIGQLLFEKSEIGTQWNIYASFAEEFVQRKLIDDLNVFASTFRTIDEFCTLFVIDPEFTSFVSLPFPDDF